MSEKSMLYQFIVWV